ncbi:MAG: peptide chain release factor 2 [Candidatus Omnitrophota bacterium]
MIEELKDAIKTLDVRFEELRGYLDLAKNREKMKALEAELSEPEIWKDQERADALSRELRSLRSVIGPYEETARRYESVRELLEIVEDDDTSSITSLMEDIKAVQKEIEKIEFKCILGEETDRCSAIVSINAGAGGTESCDWASMLFRMYLHWTADHSFHPEIVDQLSGEEAGIKNATFIVKGEFAYGYLKAEAGVHRLVRISPFDSNKRRHTSFASVDVIPDIDKNVNIEINESDIRIDTYRSSGAGGQHVNVTDSAVRITHEPTGIVVQCQKERSQHKNKETAMKLLKARLYQAKKKEQDDQIMRAHGDKKRIEWGSQIRSYVLHPYKMVKDHRTEKQTSSAEKVLDGDLDDFIEAYLKQTASKK